jgi:predicted TPR repeat methyltransferase
MLADRRADYAEMLYASGDQPAAAELMLSALERAPNWSFGWFRLGEFQETAGDIGQSVKAWQMALTLDPSDRVGAALKLQLAGVPTEGEVLSGSFVETLFDQYAGTFDVALVEKLGYRVPALLAAAIGAGPFDFAIDLGCGTGLMGERLRPVAGRLVGYDISSEMLRKAKAKGVYDDLLKADLQSLNYDGDPAALVLAADVFMYVGGLERVVSLAKSMLGPGGLFAFSVEKHAGGEDFGLRPSRRYAHSERYVRQAMDTAGFDLQSVATEIIRQDRGAPLEGLIVVARAI